MKKTVLLAIFILCLSAISANAGWDVQKNIAGKADDTAKDKAYQKEGDMPVKAPDDNKSDSGNSNTNSGWNTGAQTDGRNGNTGANASDTGVKSYRNYDFVPGDSIIFSSQLADEQAGEIPSQFTLESGQADVQVEDGENAIHTQDGTGGKFSPRMKKKNYLPDQFTVEFDVKEVGHANTYLSVEFGEGEDGMQGIELHGHSIGWASGTVEYPADLAELDAEDKTSWHHIAIAVNKNQGKAYVDQFRVANVNNLTGNAMSVIFDTSSWATLFIKNIRIAAGGIDIYKKVATDGKIVSHGILFDVDRATIKPQSMGAINQIYDLMKKNPSLRFEIGGHTDNTGNAKHNLELSEKRAESVKAELARLGIEAARLETKGFGDTKPIDDNGTPEGKANNRRVEFVKIK